VTLALLAGVTALAAALVFRKEGADGLREGMKTSASLLRSVARMLLLGMALAAMTQVILPADLIIRWMGDESGFAGILIGMAVGALIPGGPYVVIPLAASVFLAGAGAGPVAALITSWNTIPLTRTVMWELPFLGGAFTTSRIIVNLPFPIAAGLLTPPVYRLLT